MSRYIESHRGRFGVEPICRTLGVSMSAYYHRKTGERSARWLEDERLLGRIREVHAANYEAYRPRIKRPGVPGLQAAADAGSWTFAPGWPPADGRGMGIASVRSVLVASVG